MCLLLYPVYWIAILEILKRSCVLPVRGGNTSSPGCFCRELDPHWLFVPLGRFASTCRCLNCSFRVLFYHVEA